MNGERLRDLGASVVTVYCAGRESSAVRMRDGRWLCLRCREYLPKSFGIEPVRKAA